MVRWFVPAAESSQTSIYFPMDNGRFTALKPWRCMEIAMLQDSLRRDARSGLKKKFIDRYMRLCSLHLEQGATTIGDSRAFGDVEVKMALMWTLAPVKPEGWRLVAQTKPPTGLCAAHHALFFGWGLTSSFCRAAAATLLAWQMRTWSSEQCRINGTHSKFCSFPGCGIIRCLIASGRPLATTTHTT